MKVYVTKYAFSEGVVEKDGEEHNKYMRVYMDDTCLPTFLRKGEWATTLEEARVQVEAMRDKRIKAALLNLKRLRHYEVKYPEVPDAG
jgi:hypothetical protein